MDFAQDLLDDRGPILFHDYKNFDTGPEVTLCVIYYFCGTGFFEKKRGKIYANGSLFYKTTDGRINAPPGSRIGEVVEGRAG